MKQLSKKLLTIGTLGLLSVPAIATPIIINQQNNQTNTYTVTKSANAYYEQNNQLSFNTSGHDLSRDIMIISGITGLSILLLILIACITVAKKIKTINNENN